MVCPKLIDLQLIGTGFGENIGEVAESLRKPLQINLQYNGIEPNVFTSYFKYLFDFEKVQVIDLSCNWFGTEALY